MVAGRTKGRIRERPRALRLQGRWNGYPETRGCERSSTVAPLVAQWHRVAVYRGESRLIDFNSGDFIRRRSSPSFPPRLEGCSLLWQLDSGRELLRFSVRFCLDN